MRHALAGEQGERAAPPRARPVDGRHLLRSAGTRPPAARTGAAHPRASSGLTPGRSLQREHRGIAQWLTSRVGRQFASAPAEAVHGGSINQCVRWPVAQDSAFVKIGPVDSLAAYEAEAEGLAELARAQALRVPAVLAVGEAHGHALLALEWLDLSDAEPDAPCQARLGERLAAQHRVTAARHGWHRDNTIGATPQPNTGDEDWVRFFQQKRLGFQLDLAARDGLDAAVVERGRELCERCGAFFSSYLPRPSLLHGDLWGGNAGRLAATGEPVVFDPAVYFGDRETDLAMTRLFGGFGPAFYAAYQAAWPLDPAAGTRRTLYNLYHVLNHCHLFGGSYGRQAAGMIDRLLAEFG
ncbi:MAG: fructosamine kinase family protein [Gammaproteobacteria bacterium]|nr:fructosamine kinase family protein [Gammaproteobacteria bacterium]